MRPPIELLRPNSLTLKVRIAFLLSAAWYGALAGCAAAADESQPPISNDVFGREDAIIFGGGPGLADRIDLLIMNRDGSGVDCVACSGALDPIRTAPRWSPDGSAIAFATDYANASPRAQFAIDVILAEGRTIDLLLSPDMYEQPTWSPSGSEIAFEFHRFLAEEANQPVGGTWADPQICVVPLRTTGTPLPAAEVRCLTSEGRSRFPDWSPDGSQIVYTHASSGDRDVPSDIYVMEADGSGARNLSNTPDDFELEPRWSPNGRQIAYQRWDPELRQHDVWVMKADGSGAVNLTPGPEDGRYPAWSPDGESIVFATTRTADSDQSWCEGGCLGNNELYVMGVDGSNPTNITNDPRVYAEQPDWQPRSAVISVPLWLGGAGVGVLLIGVALWIVRRRRR